MKKEFLFTRDEVIKALMRSEEIDDLVTEEKEVFEYDGEQYYLRLVIKTREDIK